MTYKIIRSKRKTLGIEVNADGVTVRAPLRASEAEIERFVARHESWIEKNFKKAEERKKALAGITPLTPDEIKGLAEEAMRVIPERVGHYAKIIGVSYGRITVRNQCSKWGSCSSKGNLSFNCLLMLAPPEVLDSVVVHELCHRKEMNHSERFYAEVLRAFPEYYRWSTWLKQNAGALLARMGGKNEQI